MKRLPLIACRSVLFALLAGLAVEAAHAQLTQDQMAELLLNSARKAYNERNFPFATGKFREFLGKFGNHKDAPAARYGLALTLIEGFDKNYKEAHDLLTPIAASKDFADRPLALYYLGLSARGLGLTELQLAEGKSPQEQQQRLTAAQQRFGEAATHFTAALDAFTKRYMEKEPPKGAAELLPEVEWMARARCDLAEALVRQGKPKEAQIAAAPFVKDPMLAKSAFRQHGLYFHGYASLLLKDLPNAEKSLSVLAPFNQPVFGNHARYLLARAHHLADDRPEAAAHYEGVVTDYTRAKAEAGKLAQDQKRMQSDPIFRAEVESLIKGPVPEYIARSQFYLGVLLYEGGKLPDARARLADFLKQWPKTPLRSDAELRIGFCQVQMKEYSDAIKTLTPLVDRDPRLSDQVLFWLGKAQAGNAPDTAVNPKGHDQVVQTAINTLRQAADRAQKLGDQDPEAKSRRAEVLLEIADQLQRIRQHKESASLYIQLLNEKLLESREEEITQRLAVALHLAGDFTESDKTCERFRQKFPQSSMTPAVLFCAAENSFFRVVAAEKNPNVAERQKQLPPLYDETIKRFTALVEKYPEYPKINLARYTLGLTCYRKGDLDMAQKTLSEIAPPDRNGELALTSYLIADAILRQVPATVPEDALAAGKMEEQLKSSAELLEAFAGGNPRHNQAPDALIKLGLCHQRLAALTSQPPERAKALAAARLAYDRLFVPDYKGIPQVAQGVFERAKVMAMAGDPNGAMNELRRFINDPVLKGYTDIAPMALIQLATLLRGQNRAPESADILAKGLTAHEGNLTKDPQRSSWVGLMRYHQGVALREANKLPEARALFDSVVKSAAGRPEGNEAALRLGQTLKDEAQQRLDTAAKLKVSPKKEDQARVDQLMNEGIKTLTESINFLEGHAEKLKKQESQQDVCARMMYDAAWGSRTLAGLEIEAARVKIGQEMLKKLTPPSAKFPLPDVPLDKVPLQASEKRARGLYQSLIDSFGELPISVDARFELAEMFAERSENETALKLLGEVLDKEPSAELTEKVRIRQGVIQAAKGNLKGALAQFDAVANNPKSTLSGWAHYRAAEALLQDQQYEPAIKRLALFRDQQPFQNQPGLSDRALLRLGFAYGMTKAWDPSRQAYERLVAVFPNSMWLDDARYGIAWSLQQQKNYEPAVNVYGQVTSRTASEIAAKAQLQIGLCRLEQKRPQDAVNALLVIPTTYGYPELQAAARYEAARAYVELNQPDNARKQLETILQQFPGTPWADAAKERLESLKKK